MKKLIVLSTIVVLCVALVAGCAAAPTATASSAATSSSAPAVSSSAPATSSEAASSTVATSSSPAAKRLLKVGFVNLSDSDENCALAAKTFANIVKSDDFKKEIGADTNVQVTSLDSQMDIAKQQTNVETLLTQGVDMVFLIGADTTGNAASVQACNKAGVPIFMVATEASGGDWKFIGWDETDYGKAQGNWLVKNAPQNANIYYITGTPGREAFIKRGDGFKQAIAARPDLKIAAEQAAPDCTAEEGMQITEDWIQAAKDKMDVLVSQSNLMAQGAVQALKAANMQGKVIVVSNISAGTWDVQEVKDGEVTYAVDVGFDALGKLCADVAAKQYNGQAIQDKEMLQLQDVTKDNVNTLWPDSTKPSAS